MTRPLVSVIIPAWRARPTLARALRSVAVSGLPPRVVEIVIASDDGTEYRRALPPGQRIVLAPHGPVATGPGAARNRAIRASSGAVIAFLDADDSWAPGYLAALVPLARRHGAAFARTAVIDGHRRILMMPPQGTRLHLSDLGRYGGSFPPVLTRALLDDFTPLPSQDVRFSATLLARLGGVAPLARTEYRLRLRDGSVTAARGFADRVGRAYARHIAELEGGAGRLSPAMRHQVIAVFRQKIALNQRYMQEAAPGESFYAFVARQS